MKTEVPQPFDFWQDHSERYLEMAQRTDRRATVENPDGYGKRTGGCGDTVEIFLEIKDNAIRSVAYRADGCLNTHACANTVAELTEGGTLEQAWQLEADAVVAYLETLPPHEVHCAELAVGALYRALAFYQDQQRNPWKRAYLRR